MYVRVICSTTPSSRSVSVSVPKSNVTELPGAASPACAASPTASNPPAMLVSRPGVAVTSSTLTIAEAGGQGVDERGVGQLALGHRDDHLVLDVSPMATLVPVEWGWSVAITDLVTVGADAVTTASSVTSAGSVTGT